MAVGCAWVEREGPVAGRGRGLPRWVRLSARVGGTVVVSGVAWLTLRDQLPEWGDVGAALRSADDVWLAVAGLAMFMAMGLFARQQRRLLTGVGVRLPRHRALALALSRSAMSISLPAGALVSAAYAFRQFRASGADRRAAATVMVVSGAVSVAGLVLLYGTGTLAAVALGVAAAGTHPVLASAAVLLLIITVGVLARFVSRAIAPRHWVLALAAAVGNWAADLCCLVATARACDVPLGLVELAALFLTVQMVRQIPLTPGGIGVVEASLLAGLVGLGAPEAAAAATVLTYRLFSCWLLIPAGLAGWLVLRRAQARGPSAPDKRMAPARQDPVSEP